MASSAAIAGFSASRLHALHLLREFPEPRRESRAGHEVEQLQREEERHHEHHHHVEHHLEQHALDEHGIDADVQHAERLVVLRDDGHRHDVLGAHVRDLPRDRGIAHGGEQRGAVEVHQRPGRLLAVGVEQAPVGVGDAGERELGVLGEDFLERLVDAIEAVERDAVARGFEHQRAHRGALGRRLALRLRHELALEHAMGEVRNYRERDHHAQHDHAGELPVDSPEVILLEHG
jgi:hypothetical protein